MATPGDSSLIRCSICFNSKEGREPRILSCVHSFCQECLEEWHEKRQRDGHCVRTELECPTCRTISALPSGDISDLSVDINVQQFADYINKESKLSCHVCKIKKGKAACMMCHVFLCEDCGVQHKASPLFSAHELTRDVCELHGAALQGVCTKCYCGVCLTCVNEGLHRDHPLNNLSSGINTIKSQVKKCTVELQELLRQGNLENDEKRKFIKQFQRIGEIKETLDTIKHEVERLEMEIAEHERLCDAKIDAMFAEYEAHSTRASVAIMNGNQLIEVDEAGVLDKLESLDVPDEEMCSLLTGSLFSIPDFNAVSFSYCRIDNASVAQAALKNCKLMCGIVDVKSVFHTPESPAHVLRKNCWDDNIKNPWRLCGTLEGDVIVCSKLGGPVYKVYRDGTKKLLLDDGIAACEHRGDVYLISTDGRNLTQINQHGSTAKHNIIPPISEPIGLAVSDDIAFILANNTITKQSLVNKDYRETFSIKDCKNLSYLMKIRHKGVTKLVITDWNTHEVIIMDEGGAVLTRLTGHGSEDGLLRYPKGISSISNGNLLLADRYKHNIVEYDMDGMFIKNLLTERDGLLFPQDLVHKYPYLWVLEIDLNNSSSLKLFRF